MDFDFDAVDVCIYHRNCDDGFCSAYLVWNHIAKKGQRCIDYIDMNPSSKVDQDLLSRLDGKIVLIVDLSFSRQDLLEIKKVAKQLLVLDHHNSAMKELEGLEFAIFDIDHCGASLFWFQYTIWLKAKTQHTYVDLNDMPLLVRYIRDRDLWKFELPDSKDISSYIQTIPPIFESWNILDLLICDQESLKRIAFEGGVISRTKNRIINEFAGYAKEVWLYTSPDKNDQIRAKVVNCSVKNLVSETGHSILTCESLKPESERAKVAILYTVFSDGGVLCQMRSIAPFDCSLIAVAWGGGGHKQSCGFHTDIKDGLPWTLVKQAAIVDEKPCSMPCHSCIEKFDIRHTTIPILRLDSDAMILCEICGNKRCPHASNHVLKCTGSNDPGQIGSIYKTFF